MTITFKEYLIESASLETSKLKHLEHLEDHMINAGHSGLKHSIDTLEHAKKTMAGEDTGHKISTKWDGSPSIVFGHHPKTGKFFVASKSAFNKTPKINYTNDDVEKNHGHAPGLVYKLQSALKHLPKIAPKNGVYQGDLMYTHDDVTTSDGKYHFKPNTITYSTPMETKQGQKIAKAKLGLVVHTKYHGKDLEDMSAGFNVDHKNFKEHPDVHSIPADMDLSTHKMPDKLQNRFHKHLMAAKYYGNKIDKKTYDALSDHSTTLPTYINSTIRDESKPSAIGYHQFLLAKGQKEIDKVSTAAAKDRKRAALEQRLSHVEAHRDGFSKVLKVHHHLQQAKNALVDSLSHSSEFEHTIRGEKAQPEGFVISKGNKPTKLVNRHVFSKQNFIRD